MKIKVPLLSLVSLGFLVIIFSAVFSVDDTNSAEQLKNLEDTIMKTAIHCYAIEGAYPDDVAYLVEAYNLNINTDDYIVHYKLFATNIAPDVTVIARN